MEPTSLSANWKKLQATLKNSRNEITSNKTSSHQAIKRKRDPPKPASQKSSLDAPRPRKRQRMQKSMAASSESSANSITIREQEDANTISRPRVSVGAASDKINAGLDSDVDVGRYVAVDCEMVGVGPNPERESALARVSIVNYDGDQIYDSYVLPLEPVTDYRTHVSGISPKHMNIARLFKDVQADIAKILEDRVIIGHSIRHDLAALMLGHPLRDIRDTSRHPPYRKIAGGSYPKLKILASELLGVQIQVGEHSSIEDARACMMLFRKDKSVFEREHKKKWPAQAPVQPQPDADTVDKPRKHKNKKKKKKR
ncbi:3'-5' exonuclease [Cladophialophora chaetospira]|uniref:RNA exonuclease 4 n=1 Tax=Cladophialophora chaetospira TaxID=386627 RepID=A0AA38XI61_9EURO|nr:3'-5' exonuclease [Cladophialophora chaetospira]